MYFNLALAKLQNLATMIRRRYRVPQRYCLGTDEASEPVNDASDDVKELIADALGLTDDVLGSTDDETMSSEGSAELVPMNFGAPEPRYPGVH